MKILSSHDHQPPAAGASAVVALPNDADPLALPLDGVARIDLEFPDFNDGRAYSQAYLLRRRRGFAGDIRATGDVLIDQLVQMERTGFSSAVLKDGVNAADAKAQFDRFKGFYQGDVAHLPHFRETSPQKD
ncbi:DUF934 domain-containing protein [Ramlibacter sp. H39-3-26]|uniref:DUF934 domain-containing protein n=1 Tax=Curvibacter soli TaxID=3031331 RepID=UPI0023D9C23F|nr:DUF934 domain-containing protein [Ramlibacter sp. H39-3-26]MDF1485158.1 DUF934 domain-containing protein [Ramlibacter sp. H39-3-26]